MGYSRIFTNLIPTLLIPPAVIPSMNIACILLFLSLYTLTIPSKSATIVRVIFASLSLPFFWDIAFGIYRTHNLNVALGISCFGIYGLMRVLDTCFVGLWDAAPPFWIKGGKPVELPTTVAGRVIYAFDLMSSVRGASWFEDTVWDWAVPAVALEASKPRTAKSSRAQFLRSRLFTLAVQYIALDIFDTLNHTRTWDSNPHPITSLPWPQQLLFSFSVCACTALQVTIPGTVYSLLFVPLGSTPTAWQTPLFDHPFSASSLQDFWSHRWHTVFKRVFDRLAGIFLFLLPSSTPVGLRKVVRASTVFGVCALFHLLLLWRTVVIPGPDPLGPPVIRERLPLFNSSTLKFFLSQPFGLFLERTLIFPLTHALPGPMHMTIRRVWAWSWLLFSGRWWSDAWVRHGFWGEREVNVGWSFVRGLWKGQWFI